MTASEVRVAGLNETDRRGPLSNLTRSVLVVVFASIPITLLVASAVSWLRIGIDLPVADDWREYLEGQVDKLDLESLFRPVNDTLYPVGQFLDVLAHVALGGNSVVYQLLSMIAVLGSLLVMQWILLRSAFRDSLHTAIVFSLCSLMLLRATYWGGPNVAYHQALPLVAVLAALVLALRPAGSTWWAAAISFVLGVLAGMTYVSGAFAALAAGGTMVLIGLLGRQASRTGVLRVGAGLAIAGIVTVVVQVWAVRAMQSEGAMAGNSLTPPWQPDFWFYIAGKVGASLGLPVSRPRLALTITVVAIAAVAVAVAWSLRGLRREPGRPPRADVVSVVTLTLTATICVYLLLVGAGRSSLRDSSGIADPIEVFQFGFFRFHFFWVTLIWPWVGAIALSLVLGWGRLQAARIRAPAMGIAAAAPLLAILVAFSTGGFDYSGYYQLWAAPRLELYRCLLESVQRGDGHQCEIWEPMNPARLIAYARSIDASFARYLQTIPIAPPLDPLFTMHDASSGHVEFIDSEVISANESGISIRAGEDAQIIVTVTDHEAMRQCLTLEVGAALRPAQADVTQVFYLRPGDDQFAPERVTTTEIGDDGDAWSKVSLMLFSDEGFGDRIRLDPVFYPQMVDIADLELHCRTSVG